MMALAETFDETHKRGALDPHDAVIGGNVKKRRAVCGLSQTDLANNLGVTYQQVQKFEHGKNRIGAGRLYRISEILNCDVKSLFAGLEVSDVDTSAHHLDRAKRMTDFSNTPQGIIVIDAISKLPSDQRKRFVALAVAMTGDD